MYEEKQKKEIITDYNSDNEEFTCSEVCYKRTKEKNHDVYYCCRFCDRVNNCSDICSFIEYPEERDYEDFCEFEWVVTRCYNCDRIIEIGESSRSMRLYNSSGQSKDIELCEDCWDADVDYYQNKIKL